MAKEAALHHPPQEWDHKAIVAEVHRRGLNLTAIAISAGLYEGACRQGARGNSRAGAEVIAQVLNIPFRTLFPRHYLRKQRSTAEHNRNSRCNKSSSRAAPVENLRTVE